FVDRKNNLRIGIDIFEIVPLIPSLPLLRKVFHGRMRNIGLFENGVLLFGMTDEVTAHQSAIPAPIVFCIGGAVDTHISSARLDIAFKSCFLIVVEQIARCTEENHG